MQKRIRILPIAALLLLPVILLAQDTLQSQGAIPAPPTEVRAFDTPNDNGHSITITWKLSADDGAGQNSVTMYEILRAESPEGGFISRGVVAAGVSTYDDKGDKDKNSENYFPSGKNFYYKVSAKEGEIY